MARRHISDRWLQSKNVVPGDYWDGSLPGFGVRVSETGRKTFVLATRYPGNSSSARRRLGRYGPMTLEAAREKARHWLRLIEKGSDPQIEAERQRLAEQKRRKNTFGAVAEDFIADKLATERKGQEVARDIRKNLMPAWGNLPITDVADDEIAALVKAKARTAPSQARNLLGTIKRLFGWAVDQRAYGVQVSPAAQLKPAALCGEKIARSRVLTEDEVFAFWRTANRLPYPYGPVYRLLLLTGLRLNEVADAAWSEFDPVVVRAIRNRIDDKPIDWTAVPAKHLIWTIPAARMKAKNSKARPHAVPLTPDILTILERLPRFERGLFLFSTSFGERPVWMSDKVKKRLDSRMLRTLKAMARMRGENASAVKLEQWQNHDLRRVVRSGLSRLRVPEEVREAVLAHVRPGIKGVYDVHDYLDEKREALMHWAVRLRSIIEPQPVNVIELLRKRGQ